MSHIVTIGLMGAGKTEIGKRVAERLGRPLLDCDEVLEARTGGRTAREVADEEGIDHLHELEAQIALEMLAHSDPAVIGPAASTIEVDAVRDAFAGHIVVWLTAPAEVLAEKAGGGEHRPLVQDGDPLPVIVEQLAVRQPLAVAVADLVIDVSTTTRDEQAEELLAYVRSLPGSDG